VNRGSWIVNERAVSRLAAAATSTPSGSEGHKKRQAGLAPAFFLLRFVLSSASNNRKGHEGSHKALKVSYHPGFFSPILWILFILFHSSLAKRPLPAPSFVDMSEKKITLAPPEGVDEGIGYYLAGMEEVRSQLRKVVGELSSEQLHSKLRPDTHSIAQLALHCGEAEWWWIQCVVGGRPVDDELEGAVFWDVLEEGGDPPKDLTAGECIAEIDRISAKSRDLLSSFQDHDLGRYFERPRRDSSKQEYTLRWILHHLIDHEAQHKGQILMLKRLLGKD
jgi:uncharacterized damage-inducible protein DinB